MIAPTLTGRFGDRPGRLIEGWWWRPVTGAGLVVPDGAIDVMWCPGAVPWVAGPDTRPHPVSLAVGTFVVGLRLRPAVAPAVLGDGADRAADTLVPLDQIWSRSTVDQLGSALADLGSSQPSPGASGSALEPRSRSGVPGAAEERAQEPGATTVPGRAAALLADAVAARVDAGWSPDRSVVAAVMAIRRGEPVDEVVDLSPRQLRRRFTAAMGYGPAFYRRLARLDRFTDELARWPDRSLAQVAAAAGYHDEAHLWRDCTALTGRTPARLRADRSAPDRR